jgi:hypothetical protein
MFRIEINALIGIRDSILVHATEGIQGVDPKR